MSDARRRTLDAVVAAWRALDANAAASCFSMDGSYQEARKTALQGRDHIAAHFAKFFVGRPQFRIEIIRSIVEGPFAALEYRFTAEGTSPGRLEIDGCALVRFEGALIASWREFEG